MEPEEEDNPKSKSFCEELRRLLNKHSIDSQCNTPDWILAVYLKNCLEAYTNAVNEKEISKG